MTLIEVFMLSSKHQTFEICLHEEKERKKRGASDRFLQKRLKLLEF